MDCQLQQSEKLATGKGAGTALIGCVISSYLGISWPVENKSKC
jgi:hypothetical protein